MADEDRARIGDVFERLVPDAEIPRTGKAEALIRIRVRRLIEQFNGMFGKVMADLIAEGQAEPELLHELYDRQIRHRRAATIAELEQGKRNGEFRQDLDAQLFVDAVFGPIYYHLLLRVTPLTKAYGDRLLDQALQGARPKRPQMREPRRSSLKAKPC